MSKHIRPHALRYQPESRPEGLPTAAVLDPTESGPPEEVGGGRWAGDSGQCAVGSESISRPAASTAHSLLPTSHAPDCSVIVANLDRQPPIAWPADSSFKADWPWGEEPDPVPGDIVGWNWNRQEIAVVTAIPPVAERWPYTLTVEIRHMPARWRRVRVFDLNSGQRLDVEWYTRWNRAYSRFVSKRPR